MVEEGQDVVAAAPEGAAELSDLLEAGGHAAADGVDQPGHRLFPAAPIGVGVGRDDALIDAPGEHHRQVCVVGEYCGEPGLLAATQQRESGPQDAARPVERVTAVTSLHPPNTRDNPEVYIKRDP